MGLSQGNERKVAAGASGLLRCRASQLRGQVDASPNWDICAPYWSVLTEGADRGVLACDWQYSVDPRRGGLGSWRKGMTRGRRRLAEVVLNSGGSRMLD